MWSLWRYLPLWEKEWLARSFFAHDYWRSYNLNVEPNHSAILFLRNNSYMGICVASVQVRATWEMVSA